MALGIAGAGAAVAQQLWSVDEVATRPISPLGMDGAVASPSAVGGLEAATSEVARVGVEFDYLRLGFGYLELPLPDGSVVQAENAVFEDRGGAGTFCGPARCRERATRASCSRFRTDT